MFPSCSKYFIASNRPMSRCFLRLIAIVSSLLVLEKERLFHLLHLCERSQRDGSNANLPLLRNTGPERRFWIANVSFPGLGPRCTGRRAELRIHNADDENGFRSGRTREGVDDFVEQCESLRQGVETFCTDGGAGAGDFVVDIVAR